MAPLCEIFAGWGEEHQPEEVVFQWERITEHELSVRDIRRILGVNRAQLICYLKKLKLMGDWDPSERDKWNRRGLSDLVILKIVIVYALTRGRRYKSKRVMIGNVGLDDAYDLVGNRTVASVLEGKTMIKCRGGQMVLNVDYKQAGVLMRTYKEQGNFGSGSSDPVYR